MINGCYWILYLESDCGVVGVVEIIPTPQHDIVITIFKSRNSVGECPNTTGTFN
ncbi:hypothetical protein [Methanobacterium congolense]|uniref:hypothetical protein n=1 Tax=Methanobacterium congolense TaxID=118062 RepID=UPI0014956799|nr:hypothetical protein [Methanobacterium congolense]